MPPTVRPRRASSGSRGRSRSNGIQVNAIAHGFFATDINAHVRADQEVLDRALRTVSARRVGNGDQLAEWVVALAGSHSDSMTGEVIVIDGRLVVQSLCDFRSMGRGRL